MPSAACILLNHISNISCNNPEKVGILFAMSFANSYGRLMDAANGLELWHTIKIDEEVFRALQSHAEPLVDDPNSVLRKLLSLDSSTDPPTAIPNGPDDQLKGPLSSRQAQSPQRSNKKRPSPRLSTRSKSERAPKGSLLPEAAYVFPLLTALNEAGGSGPASEIVQRVGELLANQLTETDHDLVNTGKVRWKNRLQFVRLDLIKGGLMKSDSPRGIWEISDDGRSRLNQLKGTHHEQ